MNEKLENLVVIVPRSEQKNGKEFGFIQARWSGIVGTTRPPIYLAKFEPEKQYSNPGWKILVENGEKVYVPVINGAEFDLQISANDNYGRPSTWYVKEATVQTI